MKIEVDVDENILSNEAYDLLLKIGETAEEMDNLNYTASDTPEWYKQLAELHKSFTWYVRNAIKVIDFSITTDKIWREKEAAIKNDNEQSKK